MGGGASTPALAAAVSEAGGLGFLAAGYVAPSAIRADVESLRRLTGRPFGINLFAPPQPVPNPLAVDRYARALACRHGVAVGAPRHDDDGWEEKLALVAELRVPVDLVHVRLSGACGRRLAAAGRRGRLDHGHDGGRGACGRARRRRRARRPGRRGRRPPRDVRRHRAERPRPAARAAARRGGQRSPARRDRRARRRPLDRRRAGRRRGRGAARHRVHAHALRPAPPRLTGRRSRATARPGSRALSPDAPRAGSSTASSASTVPGPRSAIPTSTTSRRRCARRRASAATPTASTSGRAKRTRWPSRSPAGELVRRLAEEARAALRQAAER